MKLRRTFFFICLLASVPLTGCFNSNADVDSNPLGSDNAGEIWIRITYPAQWGTVAGIEEISVEAGPVGEIDSVGFFVDGQELGNDSVSPFTFTWDVNGLTGSHSIFTRAYTAAGTTDSDLLTVSVFEPSPLEPVITSPANLSVVENTITVFAEETTPVEVDSVVLYTDGQRFEADDTEPFQFLWTVPDSVNSHTLFVKSWLENRSGTSPLVTLFVESDYDTRLPYVQILSPADWSVVQGEIEVIAAALDNYGIDRVVLVLDGLDHDTLYTAPYLFPLNTDLLTEENHTLICRAYDTADNYNLSNMVTIVVDR
ncbi:MAG: hypothetical protein ISR91_00250 [Candidatus Delongbacteria bacterium]|nr:hypothetical protein [Candidatus Delongbacteria bacterium]